MCQKLIYRFFISAFLILFLTDCRQVEPILTRPTMMLATQTSVPTTTPNPTQTPLPTNTPQPTRTPEGEIGSTWVRSMDEMEMVYVPKGVFTMGSDQGDPDEQPVHEVKLDAFWIDKYEITKSMYARFDPAMTEGELPVQNITWEQAKAYCDWAGGRLPTEAEWEKASRGDDERVYPWGNSAPTGELVNFADSNTAFSWADIDVDDGYEMVAPVGTYPSGASIYGALDMAGNVSEWVNDWYDEQYYAYSPSSNPQGPDDGFFRVLRGGSYYSTGTGVRSADRSWYIGDGSTEYIGFRCAKSTVFP